MTRYGVWPYCSRQNASRSLSGRSSVARLTMTRLLAFDTESPVWTSAGRTPRGRTLTRVFPYAAAVIGRAQSSRVLRPIDAEQENGALFGFFLPILRRGRFSRSP